MSPSAQRLLVHCIPLFAVLSAVAACDAPQVSHRSHEPADPDQTSADAGPPGENPALPAGAPDAPLAVSLGACERAGCELRFVFTRPMVAGARAGISRAVRMTMQPEQAGRFAWASPTELVFKPGAGALAWGHEVAITIDEARASDGSTLAAPWQTTLRVPYFEAAGKVARWPVIPGQPRLVALLNGRGGQIGKGPVYLLYDQPVEPGQVARAVRLSHEGRALDVRVTRPGSLEHVYSGELDTGLVVAVSAAELPPHGSVVELQYPERLERVPSIDKRAYTVHTRFALQSADVEAEPGTERVPEDSHLRLMFNSPVAAGALQKALAIEPEPESFGVSWVWAGEAVVYARLRPGQRYRMTVSPDLHDELGNRLGQEKTIRMTAHDRAPALTVPDQAMVLERGHAEVPMRGQNLAHIQAELRPVTSPAAFVRMLAGSADACARDLGSRAGLWRLPDAEALNTELARVVALADSGKHNALACVTILAAGTGSRARDARSLEAKVLVQQTGLGVTAKVHERGVHVWVSRLADALPAADASVAIADKEGKILARGRADGQGLARLDGLSLAHLTSRAGLAEPAYAIVETADDIAVVELTDARMAQPWQYGVRGTVADIADLAAAVFTDRGVYRPSETVHVVVMARDADAGSGPARGQVTVAVADPRGQNVREEALRLDDYGSAQLAIELGENAAVGRYTVHVSQGERVTTESFQVQEYRVPTFRVSVDAGAAWAAGQPAEAVIEARYLHGGDMAARTLSYTVSRERVPFSPKGFAGFVFRAPDHPAVRALDGILESGEDKLDGQGRKTLAFTPSHPASAGPMRYVVDAAVTDVDRQVYQGRTARVVHPASFYVGTRPLASRVLAAGDTLDVPVVAVAPDGAVKAGVRVEVELVRVDHHTTARLAARLAGKRAVEVDNRPVEKVVERCAVRTRKRVVSCALRVPRAGSYKVLLAARDRSDRRVEAGYTFTAGGEHTIAWPRYEHERVDVLLDKPSYRPGETARLMVSSPFGRARGLLTLERGGVLEHRFFDIAGDAPIIEVPITEAHAPNVFASVTLVRPRVHEARDATGFETGAPSVRMGYAEIPVAPVSRMASVSLSAPERAYPGGRVAVDLEVRGADGAPARAQAVVMVVDEAVLGLSNYRTPDPVREIFAPRALGVRTLASVLDLPHSRRARHEQIVPSGDGGPGFGLSAMAAEMRSLFRSTAYFDGAVAVDEKGRARVEFDLPDQTTTYRVMAVVATRAGAFGSSDRAMTVNKPLMVQPVLPRFVYPEDTLRLEARVFNGTDEPSRVRVVAELAGMAGAGREAGIAPMEVTVPANAAATVGLPVKVTGKVTGRDQARVRLLATMAENQGGHRDAVEVTIPVLNPGSRRRLVERRQVMGTSEVEIELPKQRVPGTESIEVRVSQSRLGQLKESVDYLMGYPNGCIEQTTSRAYPLLVLRDLLPEMGVTVDPDRLAEYAEAGVKRLLSFQTSQGGLAYWPGSDQPHAFGTAFGGAALIEAQKRGYDVPAEAIARMADYLERSLGEGAISEEMPHGGMADADTRALFVMTLGRMGRPQPGHVSALWRARAKMTAFGMAFLAVAAAELPAANPGLVQEILVSVRAKAREEADEAYYEGARDQGWSMGSPLRTHAGALLAYATGAPGDDMQKKLLAGLLARQRGGNWGNTQENVFGIMAVAQSVKPPRDPSGAPGQGSDIAIRVDGRAPAGISAMGDSGVRALLDAAQLSGPSAPLGPDGVIRHTIAVDNRAATPAHVTVRAEYDVVLDHESMAAHDSGFRVSRAYETLAGEPIDPQHIELGALVRVRVRVDTRAKHNYVALADFLPAGLEALNTELATTQTVRQDGASLSPEAAAGLAVLSYSEIRDARVAFYANDLPQGSYEFRYLARATTPGTFLRPAATAEAMYDPDASGASVADYVVIR